MYNIMLFVNMTVCVVSVYEQILYVDISVQLVCRVYKCLALKRNVFKAFYCTMKS